MGFLNRLFGKKPDPSAPFMEHPTGAFKTAVDAMADAIRRLRALPEWKDWITFCAQGAGPDEESTMMAEIRMRGGELQVEEPVDVDAVIRLAGVSATSLQRTGSGYSVAGTSPAEAARLVDAIFRHNLGIRPFPDEGNDYAVGAEW